MDQYLAEVKALLEYKALIYNQPSFINGDPVSIPHYFGKKEDIEIAGFLSATLAWGQRKTIVSSALQLIRMMDMSPYDFIMNAGPSDYRPFKAFVHRTFNGEDCIFFLQSLQNIYSRHGGLESAFTGSLDNPVKSGILHFREVFFSIPHPKRTLKHVSDPGSGSSAKRLNMFLRWMVRKDQAGVDFGIWESIRPADLYCPLDIHTGTISRQLGLISRRQNDWKALEELMIVLRKFDPVDPVKYDYALFGMGIHKDF